MGDQRDQIGLRQPVEVLHRHQAHATAIALDAILNEPRLAVAVRGKQAVAEVGPSQRAERSHVERLAAAEIRAVAVRRRTGPHRFGQVFARARAAGSLERDRLGTGIS